MSLIDKKYFKPETSFITYVKDYLITIVIIAVVVLLCIPLSESSGYHVVSFILLFVVTILATFMGTGQVLLASTLSAIVWNYFFIPPHFTFHIDKTEDILIFGLFFIIALLNGVLTTRIRRQEKMTREREERTNALLTLTRELSKSCDISQVLLVAKDQINLNFKSDALFILQDGNGLLIKYSRLNENLDFSKSDIEIAEWVFKNNQNAGKYQNSFSESIATFYLLKGSILNPGVLVVRHTYQLSKELILFWDTFTTLISNALEREFLKEMASEVKILNESDKLYKTLFNSISHEFRIPVATIMGASDSLINSDSKIDIKNELYNEIFSASLRLNRLIENLLNMSRLETGRIKPRIDWYDINDVLTKVSSDLKDELKSYNLKIKVPKNIPLVKIDFGLIEQVLYNIVYNSLQYCDSGTEIIIKASHSNNILFLEVTDYGKGFPKDSLKNIFNKFYRSDSKGTGGIGLGLSIVKGFIEAHGGTVEASNMKNGGAKIKCIIPSENPTFTKYN
ncbi:MAG: DUF4118 domain-containing protein [Candidatus Cloacimonetes bacterium]|nr:DUF4118 domain-containing protein [Candidatus Cloacimonadota bacterium]